MAGVSRTALGHVRRALASVRDGRSGGVPLTQPYPGVPPNRPMAVALEASTEISELGNGVLVASEHAPGPWSTICVLVDAGPRYEHDSFLGASHFIDRLAYKSTLGRSHMDLMKTLEQLGGNFLCSSNRETMMYQGSVFQHALGEAVQLLSDVVLTPAYTEDEVHEQCILVGYELDELVNKPDIFISELLHRAAYGAGGLGNAHLCQKDHAERMTPAILHAFRNKMYTGERMVVAGSGMEHGQLLELAERHFGPARLARSALQPVINTPAEYLGGSELFSMKESPSNNALHMPLTQLGVGFKSVSWRDSDLYPTAVLQLILGGGMSFSVGGPGKGMYSRMYGHVMNHYHWIESAMASNVSYNDSGIFFIHGSAEPKRVTDMLSVFMAEMIQVANHITEEELHRARNQLKASLLMNLEMKTITAEDIGRQVLALGRRLSVEQLIERIDAVQAADVYRVAQNMLQSKPILSAYGDLQHLGGYEQLCGALHRAMGG